jgi:hypothetical protein
MLSLETLLKHKIDGALQFTYLSLRAFSRRDQWSTIVFLFSFHIISYCFHIFLTSSEFNLDVPFLVEVA